MVELQTRMSFAIQESNLVSNLNPQQIFSSAVLCKSYICCLFFGARCICGRGRWQEI